MGKPPIIQGYKWINEKTRANKGGGGVAIAVREDLIHRTQQPQNLETRNEEATWIQIKTNQNNLLFIGTYYGKQETEKETIVEEEYTTLTTQINTLKTKGEVVLTGDFNAKLRVEKEGECLQEESRNGKLLKTMMKNTNMEAANLRNDAKGVWTRQHRHNASERSVIDYILTPADNKIKEIITDEEGLLTLKDRGRSDHNTITVKLETKAPKEIRKTTKWKLTNKEGWKEYNQQINNRHEELKEMKYQAFIDEIRKIMKNTIGEKTITTGKRKIPKENQEVKQLRTRVKEQKKIYKETINNKDPEQIKTELKQTLKTQAELRKAIEEAEKQTTKDELNKMKSEGGTKSNAFWSHRANILGKHTKEEYDTLDEKGNLITDPDKAKEHIAQFYENLYQARPAKPGEEARTEQIESETEQIKETMKNLPKPDPIKKKELNIKIVMVEQRDLKF